MVLRPNERGRVRNHHNHLKGGRVQKPRLVFVPCFFYLSLAKLLTYILRKLKASVLSKQSITARNEIRNALFASPGQLQFLTDFADLYPVPNMPLPAR